MNKPAISTLPDPDDEVLAPFWEGCRLGELRVTRCGACARWVWYPREHCPGCGGSDLAWRRVSGRGRLFTWVTVHRAFLPAFERLVPFVAGLVELHEDPGLRIATRLELAPGTTLRIGLPVEVFFEPATDRVALPRFRVATPGR